MYYGASLGNLLYEAGASATALTSKTDMHKGRVTIAMRMPRLPLCVFAPNCANLTDSLMTWNRTMSVVMMAAPDLLQPLLRLFHC
jgi:hypothetical protein